MKTKTKELLQLIRKAKYHKAYCYYIKKNSTKKHVEWYAEQWAKAFTSLPVEYTLQYTGRREVYR